MLIRTQKELKELYGEHYDKVLGYWMSGMTKDVLPPRKATPIKRPGVVDKIVFSTLLGSYIPGMNEACSCCNYRSTEI